MVPSVVAFDLTLYIQVYQTFEITSYGQIVLSWSARALVKIEVIDQYRGFMLSVFVTM